MSLAADIAACAALVERGDPDRFLATMAAPPAARRVLFPLYAFNVEVARAPWVTDEPMIAEMRLQWWRDALEEIAQGRPVRRHEVTTPLAAAITPDMAGKLDELVVARRWDIYTDAFQAQSDFERYIDQTSGNLLWVAVTALGPADETALRDLAYGQGIANWLRAVPELEARARIPLIDGTGAGLRTLAQAALTRFARAQQTRITPAARPALLSGWETRIVLKQVIRDPRAVADGRLGQSPARKKASLFLKSITGRV